jgi:RND family efflux transporter MFP subunit
MNSQRKYKPAALALLTGLCLIAALWFGRTAAAHEGEDHGEKKPAQPVSTQAARPRTAERTVQTAQGQFRVRMRQWPVDPRDGEEVQFEAAFTERVEGGFGSGDQPLTDAKVTARITRADGRTVVADNLAAHGGGQPGVSGVHYAFAERGDYKVIFSARTSDGRQVEADFPVSVAAAPVNTGFWVGMGVLALLTLAAVLAVIAAARRRRAAGESAVRRWLPLSAGVLVFFALGAAALAYFEPPRERRAATAMPAGAGDGHAPSVGAGGVALTIPKESQLMFGIRTVPVAEQAVASGLKVTGQIVAPANAKSTVSPPVSGRVTLDPRLTVGSAVARGQRLGTIEQVLSAPDVAGLEAQRAALRTQQLEQQAAAQQARTRLNAARIELERARNLVEVGAVPKRRMQEAETAYRLAEQEVAAAEAQARVAASALPQVAPTRSYPLVAPVAGVVSSLNVTTGQQVEAGTALAEVTNLARVWLQASVFEKDLSAVRGARRATFTVTGYPNEVFEIGGGTNRLVTVGTTVNPETRTVPVYYDVANPGGRFREGMFAEITIDTSGGSAVLAVPKQSVTTEQGQTFVFVFTGGESFEKRPVVLGAEGQEYYEVKSGLEAGERVVVEGIYQLRSTQPGAA